MNTLDRKNSGIISHSVTAVTISVGDGSRAVTSQCMTAPSFNDLEAALNLFVKELKTQKASAENQNGAQEAILQMHAAKTAKSPADTVSSLQKIVQIVKSVGDTVSSTEKIISAANSAIDFFQS